MKRNILYITCLFLILLGISCSDTIPVSKETSEKPVLFPDYADVTIPYNIAPLNFKIENPHAEAFAVLKFGEEKIQVKEKGGQFYLPASDWRKLLKRATGKAIQVKLYAKDTNFGIKWVFTNGIWKIISKALSWKTHTAVKTV